MVCEKMVGGGVGGEVVGGEVLGEVGCGVEERGNFCDGPAALERPGACGDFERLERVF